MANDGGLNIVIERVFDAPRDLIWKVWTESEHVAAWWGPHGMKTRVDELDFRVGGAWRYVMVSPDGGEYPQRGEFQEIVPPELIVTSAIFEYGGSMPAQHAVLTYRFEDLGAQTKMTMTHASTDGMEYNEEMVQGITYGWNLNWDALVEYLPSITG